MVAGWISTFFEFKCLDILKENIDLAWKKLSNPQEIFKLEFGSPLLGKILAKGFTNFIKEYAQNNAAQLIGASMQAIASATGIPNPLTNLFNAYNTLWFMFAGAMSAYNDYLLKLTQENARQIAELSKVKLVELQEIRKDFIPLYNILVALSQGTDELYDLYLSQLREGLKKVYSAEKNITLVANTLLRTSYFLTQRFELAKAEIKEANELIQPKLSQDYAQKVTPPPYDEEFDAYPWKTEASRIGGNASMFESDKAFGNVVGDSLSLLARSVGIPATEEQFANMKLASKYTSALLKTGKGYLEKTVRLNSAISLFPLALGNLVDGFPDFMKKMLEFQFSNFIKDMQTLRESMASHLNGRGQPLDRAADTTFTFGEEQSTSGQGGDPLTPVPGYKPVVPVLLIMSVTWKAQLDVIEAWFDSIPVGALTANNLNKAAVDKYTEVVAKLQTYNQVSVGGQTILNMTAGVEELGQFEKQMLLFLSSATLAMYTFNIDQGVLAVGRQILQRCDVNIRRTEEIIALMEEWENYELPAQDILNQMQDSIISVADAAGFDGFKKAMLEGKYDELLNMNMENASTIATALAVVSFLYNCFAEDGKNTDDLDEVKDRLTSDLSLFNFSLEIDLDFNIFKNLMECINLRGLGVRFDLEELLCSLVKDFVGLAKEPSLPPSTEWDNIGKSFGNAGAGLANSLGFNAPMPGDIQPPT